MYRKKLERVFEGKGITFIVEKKADAKVSYVLETWFFKFHMTHDMYLKISLYLHSSTLHAQQQV